MNGILPEAKVLRLKEAAERYNRPNPFKVGDFITPLPSSPLVGAGEPHIVARVLDNPILPMREPGSESEGTPCDLIVISIWASGEEVSHLARSWMFGFWSPEERKL